MGRGGRRLRREDRARRAALRHLLNPGDRDQRLLPAHRRRAQDLRDPNLRPYCDGRCRRRRAHLLQPGRPQRPQALQEGGRHQREPAGSLRRHQRGDRREARAGDRPQRPGLDRGWMEQAHREHQRQRPPARGRVHHVRHDGPRGGDLVRARRGRHVRARQRRARRAALRRVHARGAPLRGERGIRARRQDLLG